MKPLDRCHTDEKSSDSSKISVFSQSGNNRRHTLTQVVWLHGWANVGKCKSHEEWNSANWLKEFSSVQFCKPLERGRDWLRGLHGSGMGVEGLYLKVC